MDCAPALTTRTHTHAQSLAAEVEQGPAAEGVDEDSTALPLHAMPSTGAWLEEVAGQTDHVELHLPSHRRRREPRARLDTLARS